MAYVLSTRSRIDDLGPVHSRVRVSEMKKSKIKKVDMHQHFNNTGVFGQAHPVDAEHKKASTREAHEKSRKKAS